VRECMMEVRMTNFLYPVSVMAVVF